MQVYILYGDDKFNIKRRVEEIKRVIDNEWLEFNYCILQDDATPFSAMNELRTPAIGGSNKIVHIVNDCLFKDSEIAKKAIKEKLELVPANNILLITTSKKPATNTVVAKELLKYGVMEEFALITEWKVNEIATYIKAEAIAKGLHLSNDCIDYLVDNIGNDSELINSELDKIALYTTSDSLTIKVLQTLVRNSHSNSIELAKYCLDGNSLLAVEKLNQLQSEHPLQIVATLSSCFRTWLAVKAGIYEKLSDAEITTVGCIYNSKRIYYLKGDVRTCSLSRLQSILSIIIQLEYELKTSNNTLMSRIIEISQLHEQN